MAAPQRGSKRANCNILQTIVAFLAGSWITLVISRLSEGTDSQLFLIAHQTQAIEQPVVSSVEGTDKNHNVRDKQPVLRGSERSIRTDAQTTKSASLSWPVGKESSCSEKHPHPGLQTELTRNEVAMIEKYARGKKSYLEWGTGGSTDHFSRLVSGPAFSVENFPDWCNKVRASPYVACRIEEGSLQFHCVDTGPVRGYGNPANEADIPKFANYVQANAAFGLPTYDFVLDDGRSRVAVAYQAFRYMHEDSILAIHDYPDSDAHERKRYREVERYFEKIDGSGRVAIFRKRPGSEGPPSDVFQAELLVYH